MSGLDATREIRRRETLQIIPAQYIIALTANARPEQIELCLTAGMDDVMVRGINSRSKSANWLLICLPDETLQAIGAIGTNAPRSYLQGKSRSITRILSLHRLFPSWSLRTLGGEFCSCTLSSLVTSRQFDFLESFRAVTKLLQRLSHRIKLTKHDIYAFGPSLGFQ